MKDKLLSFVVLPSIMFALFLAFSPVGRVEATGGDEQVTICHHNNGSKGFVENTVDVASIFLQNGHLTHQDGQDIIPATIFDSYDSHIEHRHHYLDISDFEWKWTAWEDGQKHGNPALKLLQEERTIYECPSGSTLIPGTARCSFSGMGNQTILNNHCIVPAEVTCPSTCGYAGGQVADGDGGLKTCPATIVCPVEEQCPTDCGYEGGTVADGQGGQKTCEPTNSCSTHRWCFPEEESPTGFIARAISIDITPEEGKPWESGKMINQYCAYPEAGVCPTECGYAGGDVVADGQGGTITCQATLACEEQTICQYDDSLLANDPLCAPKDDDPEVLGEDDETGVVLAATGPEDNAIVYVVELLLVAMLVTYSVFFTKTYLKNSK